MGEFAATERDRESMAENPLTAAELATLSDLRDFVLPSWLIRKVLVERRVYKAKCEALRAELDRLSHPKEGGSRASDEGHDGYTG